MLVFQSEINWDLNGKGWGFSGSYFYVYMYLVRAKRECYSFDDKS